MRRFLRSDLPVVCDVLAEFAAGAVFELEFGVFGADAGVRGDGLGDEGVGGDGGAFADDGFAAEDAGTGVDGDIIFEGGVSFTAAEGFGRRGWRGAPRVTPW